MSRNKVILIIIACVLLLLALFWSLTEYKDVSTNVWRESYSFSDEQPQGLYIFKELTTRFFKDIPTTTMGYPEDTINTNSLYIQFVPDYLEDREMDTLLSVASKGNDVFIISDFLNDRLVDTLPYFFDDVNVIDSSLSFNFLDSEIAFATNIDFQFLDKEFKNKKPEYYYLMNGQDWESDLNYARVATPDSNLLMIEIPFGEGRIFYHVKKDLFYNHSYRQDRMFEYTQKVFSHFDPQHIYLLSPYTVYSADDPTKTRNPLEFIMSQPALKAAYYLLILGTLLYVFFSGKRKQKIIPVTVKNENTSLEYIDTVGQLFYQQNQHGKLVKHMKNIFHHKMQKKFFVAPDHPDYVEVLAKKSKISETELQYVIDRFKNFDDLFDFKADQLVSLNSRLENIYTQIDKK